MVDSGFPRGGGIKPWWAWTHNLPNFPINCMKSKGFWCPGGEKGMHPFPPLDLPVKSVKIYQARTPPYLALSKVLAKQATPGQDLVCTHEYLWMGNSRNQKSIQFHPLPLPWNPWARDAHCHAQSKFFDFNAVVGQDFAK